MMRSGVLPAADPMTAALTFPDEGWRLAAPVLLGILIAGVIWSYARRGAGGRRAWPAVALKVTGLALLALCALNPHWTSQRIRPGANVFAILADNSEGMTITDEGAGESRAERLRSLLDPQAAPWTATLAETFELRRYTFDSRLRPVEEFQSMTFDGRSSALGSALQSLAGRFQGRPLAGVLLFTDGNATDAAALADGLTSVPPVYPVLSGSTGPARDLSLRKVSVTQTVFEDAPVTIDVEVAAAGYEGKGVVVRLADDAGATVEEKSLPAPANGRTTPVRFQTKPEKTGITFYRVEVKLASGEAAGSGEATAANNSRVVTVDRGQGPYRILYVSGRPNWEYKFLQRALDDDPQLEMTGLIRVAKREPKFDFRGRAGETSNPLFRGFGDQSRETAGTYDKPVLVRLNLRDESELQAGFPSEATEMFSWHGVILDDVEAEFFTADQQSLLQRFVTERGAGLLMLGGMESFAEGQYARTPVGEILPVYLDGAPAGRSGPNPVRFELDREGWLQPWARLRLDENSERERLDSMPPFRVLNEVRGTKPAAAVIAVGRTEDGRTAPALAVQRAGRGRTAALTVGDFWRWGTRSAETRADMDKAWRQLLRWLVADVPGRVSVAAETVPDSVAGAMRLVVNVRDPAWLPIDDASVSIEVQPVLAGESGAEVPPPVRLTAEPSTEAPGTYEVVYVPKFTGGYLATATATNAAGAVEGRAVTGWSTDLAADEYRSLVPDTALMEDLARRTGGRVLTQDELDSWARELPGVEAPVMETRSEPLWHTPWIFLVAVACLAGEWGWRRIHGLP